MTDILSDIIARKHKEVAAMLAPKPSLRAALQASPNGIIAEFKRRSPSRGWINEAASPDIVPLAYQQAGAAALSILTDKHYFGGHDDYIRRARRAGVTLPVLYKNFIVHEAQLYEAMLCGASAVLLIAACLSHEDCGRLIDKAHAMGLEVLLELHDERELSYADLAADLVGINNRNLGTFQTSVDNSFRLADALRRRTATVATPPLLVSESGISNPATIRRLRNEGFSGFLIGETFMRHRDPAAALADFINNLERDEDDNEN